MFSYSTQVKEDIRRKSLITIDQLSQQQKYKNSSSPISCLGDLDDLFVELAIIDDCNLVLDESSSTFNTIVLL